MRKTVGWILRNLDLFIASLALAAIVILTFMGVIFRYALSAPFSWLEEIQMALIVWCVFLAAGACFRTKNHVAIDMVTERLPERARQITAWIIGIITVAVLALFCVRSVQLVLQLNRTHRTTNILKIPYSIVYGIVPISTLSMIYNYVKQTIKSGELSYRKREEKGEEKAYE